MSGDNSSDAAPSTPTAEPQPPAVDPNTPEKRFDEALFRRDLDEVHLLIDFLSGRPDKNLSKLEMLDPRNRNKKIFSDEIVERISRMRYPQREASPTAQDVSFLLLAKDHLTALAAPARGLTIAFTAMFVSGRAGFGRWRQALGRWRQGTPQAVPSGTPQATAKNGPGGVGSGGRGVGGDGDGSPPGGSNAGNPRDDSYLELAVRAFPALRLRARRHSCIYFGYWYFALLFIFLTALTYWDVTFGNAILERLHGLDKERATIVQSHESAEEKCGGTSVSTPIKKTPEAEGTSVRVERDFGCGTARASGVTACHHAAKICPRHQLANHSAKPSPQRVPAGTCSPPVLLLPAIVAAPSASSTAIPCRRLQEIDEGKLRAHNDLLQLIRCEGSSCAPPLRVLRWSFMLDDFLFPALNRYPLFEVAPLSDPTDTRSTVFSADDRRRIAASDKSIESILAIYSSYVLPLMFGIIGTMIGGIREIRDKVRGGELAPRDVWMLFIGLPMGIVGGLVVGLFISPDDTTVAAAGGPTGRLTLSAIALGFLAGYGSESFFTYIDTLFRQVFRTKSDQTASG
jgi:hypothetical protein